MKSTDDILKLLEEAENKNSASKPTKAKRHYSIKKFIRDFKIVPGNNRTPITLIYFHYSKFCTKYNYPKRSKIEFGRQISELFQQVRTGRERFYMIDSTLEDNPPLREKARKHAKAWQNKTKAEKKPKKSK